MTEFFPGSLRGSSDLASSKILLLPGGLARPDTGVLSTLVLALTQTFLFVSDFSRITFFLLRLTGLDEAFPITEDKSLFVKTTEEVFFEVRNIVSVSRIMSSSDMMCHVIVTPSQL